MSSPSLIASCLPDKALRARAVGLFEQQMWMWGGDVRHASGNLLCAYGAHKRPSPVPRYPSAYSLLIGAPTAAGVLTLWGWGVWCALPTDGSLLIARDRMTLQWKRAMIAEPVAVSPADLPVGDLPADSAAAARLLRTTLMWIADYERWVLRRLVDYRQAYLAAWGQRRLYRGGVDVSAVPDVWDEIASAIDVPFDPALERSLS